MTNMTLSIPEGLHEKMEQHPEFRWSEIARQAFEKKIDEAELMEKILRKSRLTEKDAEEIGHRIKGEIRKRFDK